MDIGFVLGRLSPLVDGKIQAFPMDHWVNEFKVANENNFHIMEWTLDQLNLYENPLMTKDGQNKIKFLSDKYEMSISSLTGDCFMQVPFYKVYGKDQYNLLQDLKSIITACGLLDIKFIVFPLVDNGSLESKEQEQTLKNGLSLVESLLQMNDVKIVFESDFPPARLNDFISDFPPERYGINYDIGNSAALGYDPSEEIDLYGNRIKNVHIKDRKLDGNTVPLGEGHADLARVFKELIKAQYSGNYILQTARAKDGDHAYVLCRYRDQVIKWME